MTSTTTPTGASAPLLSKRRGPTSSLGTRILGWLSAVGLVVLAIFALWVSKPDVQLGESVRIMYIHVPTVSTAYVAMVVAAVASAWFLRTRSPFADAVAVAAGEIGVILLGLTLVTGSIWGKATWGTYWTWDGRLTSTAMLFLVWLGYVGLRASDSDGESSTAAAVVAIVGALLIPVVSKSVDWWQGLHQQQTVFGTLDPKIDGTQLFTLMWGMVAFAAFSAWLGIHRFRLAWLVHQARTVAVDAAIVARRAEATPVPASQASEPHGGAS